MNAMEAILTRRSVRNFRVKDIHPETIKELLRAAMHAPSAADERPWHFLVIDDRSQLDRIPELHPYAAMVAQAPMAILVCGDPAKEKHAGMWMQDCAAATQNILISAHALGLGTVWVGVYPREERMGPLRKLFRIPENIMPFALIPLGYSADAFEPVEDRYSPDRVHANHW